MVQIHKAFTDEQVRELMQRYVNQQVDRKHLHVNSIWSVKWGEFCGLQAILLPAFGCIRKPGHPE
jgi:hypothetical protein